jgi:hypothetical protein
VAVGLRVGVLVGVRVWVTVGSVVAVGMGVVGLGIRVAVDVLGTGVALG